MTKAFPGPGTHLARYARVFGCVEMNSTFYRPHRPSTYARWAAVVPPDFRFALKLPKTISHERRLVECGELVDDFVRETAVLEGKRGPLLLQLPPSFGFDPIVVAAFLTQVRDRYDGPLVCEPRHPSWFDGAADALLHAHAVARAAADPAVVPAAAVPGGWPALAYYRWHGSPRVYFSAYDDERLDAFSRASAEARKPAWCIFDNTAHGAAAGDALRLLALNLARR